MLAILSDTHGLLRPEVLTALAGAGHILHAGDVGDPGILTTLRTIAPVTAIRGNVDTHGPCAQLPATEALQLAGHWVYMLHNLADLDIHPHAAGFSLVVSGHTHKAKAETRDHVLYLNPGSVGPRRFNLPITLALLDLTAAPLAPRIITL